VRQGESAPTPHFFQNLGEAEYVVAAYQYMRLAGYPADRVAILTTYNGQKQLIRDVLQQRCANARFGLPRVSTVDKFQGQQADYVLLSLVRSEHVGHLRDVRRLVVALSRARLGLYVFGRRALFEPCPELRPALGQLFARPTKLTLIGGESYAQPPTRAADGSDASGNDALLTIEGVTDMGVLVFQLAQAQQAQLQQQAQQQQQAPPQE